MAAVCAAATLVACTQAVDVTAAPSATTPASIAPAASSTSSIGIDSTSTTTLLRPEVPGHPAPDPPPPPGGQAPEPGSVGVAVVAAGGATLAAAPSGVALVRAREGVVMPVEGRDGDWFRLLTPCDDEAWVQASEIRFTPQNPGSTGSIESAVIVLDPGHGGPNRGATGPTGLAEPEVNLDIARRARDLLQGSHDVDWSSGAILTGDTYGPASGIWLTRSEGPPGADYEAGLLFRARLAAAAGADALISIHNNAEPDGPFDGPGSEAYYSIHDTESRRLAGLIVEEFRRGFADFDVAWMGDTDAGAKYRLNTAGDDYYGVVRYSEVPVVITEGAFISSPDEEELLRTPEFRQAYAEAIYRAVIRFVATDDPGSGFTEPYPRDIPAGSGAPLATCEVPAQP
ncbi:MAG: N-acetylmuramoyl-L-alanine amidase [Acidimicrobiia bacterium]|nr:N-acetylmuramoyl-L-alanine amidase [Acidimicrobiia bacterium]